eukprot:3009757-Prymnesium_polylepis.2
MTVFVYLNDVPRGGRTRFLTLDNSADFYEKTLPLLATQVPGAPSALPRVQGPLSSGSLDFVPVKGRAVIHFPTARHELPFGCLPDS